MHKLAVVEIVNHCIAIQNEGDAQITISMSVETLENCVVELASELSAMTQRAKAAEAIIKASQEQKSVAILHPYGDSGWLFLDEYCPPDRNPLKLYAAPVIPPDVAELQRENAELARKLAEHQAVPEGVVLHLSELQLEYRHDDNSSGDILCPACSAYEPMNWKNGVLQNEVSEFMHDSDCPIIWAKAMLAAAPQPGGSND